MLGALWVSVIIDLGSTNSMRQRYRFKSLRGPLRPRVEIDNANPY